MIGLRGRPLVGSLMCASLAIAWLVSVGGCAEPLLGPSQPRSQYDRYDRLRNQHAPQYKEDELGRRTPNIRARLTPKP